MARTKAKDELTRPTGTVIGQGFTIQTVRLTGSDPIRVDGMILGNVDLDSSFHLSETGVVEGDVIASTARIAGTIMGNVTCQAVLHLAGTANVKGDLAADAIICDQGAVFHGMMHTRRISPSETDLAYQG